MKPVKLTEQDVRDFEALPLKEKIKAWDSYQRLVKLGQLEPIEGLIEKPEGA
jgi:hypothetical protein